MKKLALLLFLLTATLSNAQMVDNRSYSLKEVEVAPVLENNVSLESHFKKNFKPATKVTEPIKVSFTIEKGGVARGYNVFGELPDATKKEVIRVLKTLPKWKPGTKGGKPVRVLYTATLKP